MAALCTLNFVVYSAFTRNAGEGNDIICVLHCVAMGSLDFFGFRLYFFFLFLFGCVKLKHGWATEQTSPHVKPPRFCSLCVLSVNRDRVCSCAKSFGRRREVRSTFGHWAKLNRTWAEIAYTGHTTLHLSILKITKTFEDVRQGGRQLT